MVFIIKWLMLNIVLATTLIFGHFQVHEKLNYISVNYKEKSLISVLEDLKIKMGVNFIYVDKLVKDIKITCKVDKGTLNGVVAKIMNASGITFKKFSPNSYVLFKGKKPLEKRFRAVLVKKDLAEKDTTSLFVEPRLISQINLVYPSEAIKHNLEGKVLIKILINEVGNVVRSDIEETSGSLILDSATVNYTNALKYQPAFAEGKPIHIWVSMLFKYFLEKSN
jgi:TonB family protein